MMTIVVITIVVEAGTILGEDIGVGHGDELTIILKENDMIIKIFYDLIIKNFYRFYFIFVR